MYVNLSGPDMFRDKHEFTDKPIYATCEQRRPDTPRYTRYAWTRPDMPDISRYSKIFLDTADTC